MQAFTMLTGVAAPLLRDNIDTDVIIRMDRLHGQPREHLARYALEAIRIRSDGMPDPASPLNADALRDAPILLAGANFGCGSSREGAVWALRARGIRCVIAESFGDIFFSNCFQNGVLPIRLAARDVQRLADASAGAAPLTVDLARRTITATSGNNGNDAGKVIEIAFAVDALQRECLLQGLDAIDSTLTRSAAIDAWQAADRLAHPWVWEGA